MQSVKKHTISSIKNAKNNKKLTMLTSYDALFSRLFDGLVDMILVGDSLNMTFGGNIDTLSLKLEEMIYHLNAVARGAKNTFIIADLPFGTYNSPQEALKNSMKIYQQSSADAVKLEGGANKAEIIKHLTSHGIAVMGHIGLLPQSVRGMGGYKIKGKNELEEEELLKDAKALEEAGAFCMVIEGVKANVASKIAKSVKIPCIGIGAGAKLDGQVLVFSDMLGLNGENVPKFVKTYLNLQTLVQEAVKNYVSEVQNGTFPSDDFSY